MKRLQSIFMRAICVLSWLLMALAVEGATPEVGKDTLRKLVKLPTITFPANWQFDPERGFTIGSGEPDVLALFRLNPFAQSPPKFVRSVVWQYWFTDRTTKRATGQWWRREFRGLYAPTLQRTSEGKIIVSEWPQTFIPPP